MIRIHRPPAVPAVLARAGAASAAAMHAEYLAHRAAFRRGERHLTFEKHYGHPTVKEALVAAQHGKCAFCESKVRQISPGDVEHFRPKAGYRQLRGGPLQRPGYYWLAYAWENLLFVCELCNRREKSNWFPLEKGSRRARSPDHGIAHERPRFIDPAGEDPGAHLTFREHAVIAVNGSRKGKMTRRGLGLNRRELSVHREEYLRTVRLIYELVVEPPGTPGKARAAALLRRAASPEAEYSAMVRAYLLAQGFPLDPG
jgi:uncharacterized protein (TIGR02646 family)